MDNRGLSDARSDARNESRNDARIEARISMEVRNQVRDLLPDLIAELTKQITQDVMVAMNSRISNAVNIAVKAEIKSALSGGAVSTAVESAVESAVDSAVSSAVESAVGTAVDEKVAQVKRQITTEVAQTQLALSTASQRDLRNQVARDIASAINTNVMPQINNFMEGMADRNADHTEMITDYRRAVNSDEKDRTAARRAIKSSNANVMGRGFRQRPAITHDARGRGGSGRGSNGGSNPEPPNVQSLFSLEY